MADSEQSHRAHRSARAGPKSEKVKAKHRHANGYNPRAFVNANPHVADKLYRRNAERDQKKLHVPMVNRTDENEAPPILVAVVGPEGVGKTTLMRSLVRRFTKHTLADIRGPVTVVSGKHRRITFIECNNDINSMIDIGKVADLVLLMIDGSFGFEMETMEFLNILQAHGFPKVIGVLTHLDLIKKQKTLRATKKRLKQRFWTEIYAGAKLFYLSGIINGRYPDTEIQNLSRFISVMKFRPLSFRNAHPYVLADRMEDLTPREQVRLNPKGDRICTMYGYLRGTNLRPEQKVHIPGVGDLSIASIERLSDPCPLPTKDAEKRRRLDDKGKLIHAPMSDVGGVMFDKDAVYITVPGNFSRKEGEDDEGAEGQGEGERMVMDLQGASGTLDARVRSGELRLFDDDDARPLSAADAVASSSRNSGKRVRRAAFDDVRMAEDDDDEGDDDEGDEGDETGEEDVDAHFGGGAAFDDDEGEEGDAGIAYAESDSDLGFEDEEDDDDAGADVNSKWKKDLAARAQAAVAANKRRKAPDLMRLIYDSDKTPEQIVSGDIYDDEDEHAEQRGDDDDDFFQLAEGEKAQNGHNGATAEEEEKSHHLVPDQSRPAYKDEELQYWDSDKALDSIRHLFITGAEAAMVEDEYRPARSDDGQGSEDEEEGDGEAAPEPEDEEAKAKALADKKAALKRKFDEQYDNDDDAQAEGDWYTEQKAELARQAEANKAEFDDEDEATRQAVQGFRPGAYVRIQLERVPCELVDNFDPRFPLIVGGLLASEEAFGFVQVRIKRHRWHQRILKTNDPLIFSMGWRRFQSIPIYSLDDGTRNRMLKYTPEHMHCLASFWGPATRPNTGFCAFNTLSSDTPSFRISANGTVLDADAGSGAHRIVKKLKLTGVPTKIFKNTAFIKDMFNSSLEVAKFEGAHIKTVSGIRGQIKKALAKPEGHFRAAFEDKILMSDIVFLRAWYAIHPRKFYNPVTSLLLSPSRESGSREWQGMRLTGAVRRDERIKTPRPVNSIYKPIERPANRKFNALKIPRSLQAALPFASKPKVLKKQANRSYMASRAVVLDKDEKQAQALLQQMASVQKARLDKRRTAQSERREKKIKEASKGEEIKGKKRKETIAQAHRVKGIKEAKRQKTG